MTPESFERDPENRLASRGPRFRLPVFAIRDQALAASGLLVDKLGGPPVKGYQPKGVWEEATFGLIKYEPDKGEALYRRSVYQFWRRIVGPTMFFDTAARQTCTVKQGVTNTPLQYLLDAQHASRRDDEPNVRMIRPDDLVPLVCVVTFGIVELPDALARGALAASLAVSRRAAVQRARDFQRE